MPTDPNTLNLIWVFTAILLPIVPALLLYKLLPSTADVSGPFHGMQIKLGGAFAGYFLLVLVIIYGPQRLKTEEKVEDEVWTVRGKILDESGTTLPEEKVTLSIHPSTVDYTENDGRFKMNVLVKHVQSRQREFPTLLVEWQPRQSFGNADPVYLDPSDQLFDTKKYKLDIDRQFQKIVISDPIILEHKVTEKAYAPAEPVPSPTVLPTNPTTSNTP
jgi:hypothetical protein